MSILAQRASDVRIQEINLSSVITSASSAVGCQVIVSKQGSTDPRLFTNADDYLAEYGNPDASVSMDVYCGLNFFTEGNQLWARRAVHADAVTGGTLMHTDSSSMTTMLMPLSTGVVDPKNPDWATLGTPSTDIPVALFYPKRGPGSYSKDISVSITSNNILSPSNLAALSASTGGTLVSGSYQYQISAIGKAGETLVSSPVTVVIVGNAVTNSIALTWDLVPLAVGYRIYGRHSTGVGLVMQVGQGIKTFLDTGAVTPDTTKTPITSGANLPPPDNTFTVNVFNLKVNTSVAAESFVCTFTDNTDANGNSTELETRINPFSNLIEVSSNVVSLSQIPVATSTASVAMGGGNSGSAPTAYDIAATFDVFKNKQLYPINLMINSGHANPIVQLAMDTIAVNRGDCVALLDVPSDQQQFQQAINYRNLTLNLNSSYSALFNPDQYQADNINGKSLYIPFSGWAAALCARTDRVANPSFSPAGLNRGIVGVLKSRYTFDDGQATAMFQAQVNYTQTFVGEGIALWEQKTLAAQDSALSWISVRRIVNTMKTAIYKSLVFSLQEPNDDFTGRQIVGSISDYLENIRLARGIMGYTVVSDSSNNTAAMFNSGRRRVTVIIIPTIPIHEIELAMVISKQGVSFTETLRAANQ